MKGSSLWFFRALFPFAFLSPFTSISLPPLSKQQPKLTHDLPRSPIDATSSQRSFPLQLLILSFFSRGVFSFKSRAKKTLEVRPETAPLFVRKKWGHNNSRDCCCRDCCCKGYDLLLGSSQIRGFSALWYPYFF